jgi:hypothetical protein
LQVSVTTTTNNRLIPRSKAFEDLWTYRTQKFLLYFRHGAIGPLQFKNTAIYSKSNFQITDFVVVDEGINMITYCNRLCLKFFTCLNINIDLSFDLIAFCTSHFVLKQSIGVVRLVDWTCVVLSSR